MRMSRLEGLSQSRGARVTLRTCCTALALMFAFRLGAVEAANAQQQPKETPFAVPANDYHPMNYKGFNIAGGEQHPESTRPYGYDYIYPRPMEMDYFAARGFGLIRMPINISRVQPKNLSALDATQTDYLKKVLDYALTKNMWVVIDAHNYGYVTDSKTGASRLVGMDAIGTAIFIDFWQRVATKFKNYPNVIFGLMNEPNKQTAVQWRSAAIAAHDAIRALGISKPLILLQGSGWDGASTWYVGDKGNGDAWAGVNGDRNVAFEVHQYLDSYSTGTHAPCQVGIGATALIGVTNWARVNKVQLFLGEFGWAPDLFQNVSTQCSGEGRALMGYIATNSDVWGGWAYWNGGSWAFYNNYMYAAQPAGSLGAYVDKPQMSILAGALYQPRS